MLATPFRISPIDDFLRDVRIRTQSAAVASRCATGTPTKRQVSKRQVSKRPVSKRLKRQVYKT